MARPVSIQRETILKAARSVFMEHGYGARTANIAREAGVSEGSLFKHFKTKTELFLAAMDVETGTHPWQEHLDKVAGEGDVRAALVLAGEQLLQWFRLILPRLIMIKSSGITIPKPRGRLGKKPQTLQNVEAIERYFAKEVESGRLAMESPRIQAHAFVGALSHYAWCETVFKLRPAAPTAYVRTVVDMVLKSSSESVAAAVGPAARRLRTQASTVRAKGRGLALAVLSCTALLAGCGQPKTQAPTPPPPEVATVVVTPQSLLLTTELPGRTVPCRVAEIRPQVSGLILKRLFTEGSEVQAGQELYQIDPAPFQAALDSAKAGLGRVEATLPALRLKASRLKDAWAEKAVSQQDYDNADAALQQAEADLLYWKASVETTSIQLRYAHVTAPVSGRIGTSAVTDGAIVAAYQPLPLATIQQLDPIYVDVLQSTAEQQRLRQRLESGRLTRDTVNGNKVQLLLDGGAKYPLDGTLQFSDVSVDPTTGSVTLRLVFPNPNGVLLPGMFVRAVVVEGINEKALLVPQQAVSRDPKGNPLVLIVNATGKVEQRMLGLERTVGDQWLVSSGLAADDRVIVEGRQRVRPGADVREVSFDGGAKAKAEPGSAGAAVGAPK